MIQPFHNEPESGLLPLIATGNEAAFQELMDRYSSILYGFLLKLTFDPNVAEEILQDTFLKIWITRENLINVQSFKLYIFIVSRQMSMNRVHQGAI